MRAWPMLWCCLLLAACASSTPRSKARSADDDGDDDRPRKAVRRGDDASRGETVEVNTKETPILRCGPMDSYVYVAREFQCPDGSNPLGGSPRAGAAARVGNVGAASNGHIIDLYEIPCEGGARRVYVDMYGCKDGQGDPGGTGI